MSFNEKCKKVLEEFKKSGNYFDDLAYPGTRGTMNIMMQMMLYIKGTSGRDGDEITKKIKEGASFNDLLIPDRTITSESYKTKTKKINH